MGKNKKAIAERKKREAERLAKKKPNPTPIIKGAFDKGILTFMDESSKLMLDDFKNLEWKADFGTIQSTPRKEGWDIDQLKQIYMDGQAQALTPPKDNRTDGEKWADDWLSKQSV